MVYNLKRKIATSEWPTQGAVILSRQPNHRGDKTDMGKNITDAVRDLLRGLNPCMM